jgi:outer membrane protein assembly factor BamB
LHDIFFATLYRAGSHHDKLKLIPLGFADFAKETIMRILMACLCATALLPACVLAQYRTNVLTQPRIPEQRELDKYNLKLSFVTPLPVDGTKDGVAAMQLLDQQLLVQLRDGYVMVFDAETGVMLWNARPGNSYPLVITDATADDRYIIMAREVRLYAYERQTGRLEWVFELPAIPSSPPISDGDHLYICVGGVRLLCYDLPSRGVPVEQEGVFAIKTRAAAPPPKLIENANPADYKAPAISAKDPGGVTTLGNDKNLTPSIAVMESVIPPYRLNSSTRQITPSLAVMPSTIPPYKLNNNVQLTPSITVLKSVTRVDELSQKVLPDKPIKQRWFYEAPYRIVQPAHITYGSVVVCSTDRKVVGFPRLKADEMFRYETAASIIAPMAQYGDTLYVPTLDGSVYAIGGMHGKMLWRYTADTALSQKPAVIDDDIFLTTVPGQFYRINRITGESVWRDASGQRDRFVWGVRRFLAANDRYVYVQSMKDDLMILDRQRGAVIGRLPISSFLFTYENSHTDRVYLANHDGSMLSLRDYNLSKPIIHRHQDPAAPATEPAPGSIAPKPKEEKPFPKAKEEKPKDVKPKDEMPKEDKPKEDKPKENKPKEDKP